MLRTYVASSAARALERPRHGLVAGDRRPRPATDREVRVAADRVGLAQVAVGDVRGDADAAGVGDRLVDRDPVDVAGEDRALEVAVDDHDARALRHAEVVDQRAVVRELVEADRLDDDAPVVAVGALERVADVAVVVGQRAPRLGVLRRGRRARAPCAPSARRRRSSEASRAPRPEPPRSACSRAWSRAPRWSRCRSPEWRSRCASGLTPAAFLAASTALPRPVCGVALATGVVVVLVVGGGTVSLFGRSTVNQAARNTTAPMRRMRTGWEIWLTSQSIGISQPGVELHGV